MNKRQKSLLINLIVVVAVTIAAVVGMVNLKDVINRSEAIRAMERLGQIVVEYRKRHGSIPSESYVDGIKDNLPGGVRFGNLRYRARWISFDSSPDEILAYSKKTYRSSFLDDGYVVLRLDSRVEWMGNGEFKLLLAQQQNDLEAQLEE